MKDRILSHLFLVALGIILLTSAVPHPSAVASTSAQGLPPGGFVLAEGGQLTRVGLPIQLKGLYYEPQGYTSVDMWQYWDSTRIAHDLQLAHDYAGINAVIIRLPYIVPTVTPDGKINDEMMLRIRELLQIVGDLDMRVIFTLFDNYDAFPMPGRNSERLNIDYLEHLIGSFAGDERIIGWNIYNKPDRHSLWGSDKPRVMSWLVRMANQIQRLTPNQLVLVTMDGFTNVWEPDFDGHVLYDFVDVIMLRGKDAEDMVEDAAAIRERTDKPIIVYDFAWSSGPPCRSPEHTESQQALVHRAVLNVMAQGHVSGVFMRRLHDIDSGPLDSWDDKGFHEGLLRLDYTPKPVMSELWNYDVTPLPNVTTTNLPLRVDSYKKTYVFDPESENDGAPRPIEGTNHYVKRDIRRVWDTFGGRHNFGLPLTEAYKRAEDNRVVQYFESAVLVLHPDARDDEDYDSLGEYERLMARVRVTDVGIEYTAGRTFPLPNEKPDGGIYYPETGHYLSASLRARHKAAGGDWRFGAPISEQFIEEVNGQPMLVQYFERGRIDVDPTTNLSQFAHLGSWRFAAQCTR